MDNNEEEYVFYDNGDDDDDVSDVDLNIIFSPITTNTIANKNSSIDNCLHHCECMEFVAFVKWYNKFVSQIKQRH